MTNITRNWLSSLGLYCNGWWSWDERRWCWWCEGVVNFRGEGEFLFSVLHNIKPRKIGDDILGKSCKYKQKRRCLINFIIINYVLETETPLQLQSCRTVFLLIYIHFHSTQTRVVCDERRVLQWLCDNLGKGIFILNHQISERVFPMPRSREYTCSIAGFW